MDLAKRIRSALAWLVMATLCALVGFMIVHYYATNGRGTERFAIVIDAGSTQTRSSLFRLTLATEDLHDLQLADQDKDDRDGPARHTTLGRLFQVQQISSCVNGGPLASIPDQLAADQLVRKCLNRFVNQIHQLTFTETTEDGEDSHLSEGNELANFERTSTAVANDLDEQLAIVNNRVNSITHLHLGATAGMRALEQLNSTLAGEKLDWIERSISNSNQMLPANEPHVNKGYVGILSAANEASFGWVSVNFVCEALVASAPPSHLPRPSSLETPDSNWPDGHGDGLVYEFDGDSASGPVGLEGSDGNKLPYSIGTLELGGASAQMAFQVDNSIKADQIRNLSLDEQQLALFNGHYKLATRSDLCLGMSQAVLRANYVLLYKTIVATIRSNSSPNITLASACLQKGSRVRLSGRELSELWQGACLLPNDKLSAELAKLDYEIRALATSRDFVEFTGTGNIDHCNVLLEDLVEPQLCRRYFSLCPKSKLHSPPPKNMPLVTISGYNHALRVLNLVPSEPPPSSSFDQDNSNWSVLTEAIDVKLGGRPIAYDQFVQRTRHYCSTDVNKLNEHYPKVPKQYQNVICLQLVYIRKLLVEFYQIDPLTSWQQIKFLVFEPKLAPGQPTELRDTKQIDTRPEIGWTLGFLLNATSHQLESNAHDYVYHHHGASPMYIVRATILLVVACSLIAIGLLVISVIQVRQADGEIDSPPCRSTPSSSSYNIGTLGYTVAYPANYNTINADLESANQGRPSTARNDIQQCS